jgi:hypothetical protein
MLKSGFSLPVFLSAHDPDAKQGSGPGAVFRAVPDQLRCAVELVIRELARPPQMTALWERSFDLALGLVTHGW